MIRHGIAKGTVSADEEAIQKYLEIAGMEDCMEKHRKMAIINPDDYRSWASLKKYIGAKMNWEMFQEHLQITQDAIEVNPKSYFPWNHRYYVYNVMRKQVGTPEDLGSKNSDTVSELQKNIRKTLLYEGKLCKLLFKMDPRNFHCWNYCIRMGLVIPLDFANYSSVNYALQTASILPNSQAIEVSTALKFLYTAPGDEAAWRCVQRAVSARRRGACYIKKYDTEAELIFVHPFHLRVRLNSEALTIDEGGIMHLHSEKVGNRRARALLKDEELLYVLESNEDVLQAIDEIIKIMPTCFFALKHKLETSAAPQEREELIEKLVDLDPLRKEYYTKLKNRYYAIYCLTSLCPTSN